MRAHTHTPSSHPIAGLEVPCPHGVPLPLSLMQRGDSVQRGSWSGWGLLALQSPLVQGQGSPGHPHPVQWVTTAGEGAVTGDMWVCGLVPRPHIFIPVVPVRTWGSFLCPVPTGVSPGGLSPSPGGHISPGHPGVVTGVSLLPATLAGGPRCPLVQMQCPGTAPFTLTEEDELEWPHILGTFWCPEVSQPRGETLSRSTPWWRGRRWG